jgi:putative ABC transport system ATP-binding protein
MINIQDVRFAYPHSGFRLAIESLQVSAGEKVAVVGPSGSGKTTLLNLISGICVPQAGEVEVHGQHVSATNDAGRRSFRIQNIGFIFQQFELVQYLSVRDNILLPYLINRSLVLDGTVRERAEELARNTGIGNKLHRRVNRLSQGEQQRVAICRALLTRPSLILADEPTGNLDPRNKRRILDLLFQQCEEGELTLVAVTHDTNILGGFDRTIDFEEFFQDQEGMA